MLAPRIFAALLATALVGIASPSEAAPTKKQKKFNDSDPGVTLLTAKTSTTHAIVTRKGTKLTVMHYPGEKWYPQAEWLPAVQKGKVGTTSVRETKLRDTQLRDTQLRDTNIRDSKVRQTGVRENGLRETGQRTTAIRIGPNGATRVIAVIIAGPGDQEVVKPVVDLLHTMGVSVVSFTPEGVANADWKLQKGENPTDVSHAVLTWTAKKLGREIADEQIMMFGIGKGADVALQVAARRNKLVAGVITDGASNTVLASSAKRLRGSNTKVLVLGGNDAAKTAIAPLGKDATVKVKSGQSLVSVMPGDHVSFQPKVLTNAAYQTAVARFVLVGLVSQEDIDQI